MMNNFNEFYPTITNLRSGMMDFNNYSQNVFEEDKNKQAPNYKCSLIDIPEINDQSNFMSYFKNNDEPIFSDLIKKQKNSVMNFSHNSIFNLDALYRPANTTFKPIAHESNDVQQDDNQSIHFNNLWVSKKNIFENDNCNETPIPPVEATKEYKPLEKKDTNKKKERVACHCKKSKCLRLYCECFAKGLICGVDCVCDGCHNTNELKDLREMVVQETLEKNPFAFKSKYKKMKEDEKILHSRGCNCSKTGCIKKYCECYNAGTGCSRLCKCTNCKNDNIELEDSEVRVYYDRVLRKRSKKSVLSECFEHKKENMPKIKHC